MENNKWNHFGRWIEPVLSSGIWLDFRNTSAFTVTGLDFFGEIRQLKGHYYLREEDIEKVIVFVKEKIEKNIKWFDGFFQLCEEKNKEVASAEGKNDIGNFFKSAVEAANCTMAIEFLDVGVEKYIEKMCEGKNTTVPEIISQIKPFEKTLLIQYQKELKELTNKEIKYFVKKWEWVGTHFFMGQPLTEKKVKNELKHINQEIIEKKNKIPEGFEDIFYVGSKMAFYRSYIVEQIDRVAYTYWPMIKNIGEKNNLSWEEVLYLNHYEIIELKNKGKLPENFSERKNGFGAINSGGQIKVIVGQELIRMLEECEEKIDKNISEIKGMVACKGGKIKGVVKIIEESKYISKMNKGDILVANETTPDYVIGMKIVGAIITNQGGITSHAAIISREMKIPCIIGTKIATKVLKDGDWVEADTDKGVVKILKKA
ncbi:MAG: pyruvate, water dikinase [Parcubacteria group bacterium Licking1014_1]|nr:MAG: pyruvate, water dikinase [Parcubacteria group bacterium Licking1014_1]